MFQRTPDLTEMWETFSSRQQTFIPNYIAYHYYRGKGWVPKTGLKFGSDFSKFCVTLFGREYFYLKIENENGEYVKETTT